MLPSSLINVNIFRGAVIPTKGAFILRWKKGNMSTPPPLAPQMRRKLSPFGQSCVNFTSFSCKWIYLKQERSKMALRRGQNNSGTFLERGHFAFLFVMFKIIWSGGRSARKSHLRIGNNNLLPGQPIIGYDHQSAVSSEFSVTIYYLQIKLNDFWGLF